MIERARMRPVWGLLVVLALGVTTVGAQEAAEPPAQEGELDAAATDQDVTTEPGNESEKAICPVCDLKDRFHQEVSWLEWGADFRAREIYQKNNTTLDGDAPAHERHWQRYRTRLWAEITPMENLHFNLRLVNENRNWCKPEGSTPPATRWDGIRDWDGDEVIFDHANVVWEQAFGLPLQIKAGRQDIILGDGWLVLEGTPMDGSRTLFFDAVRGTLQLAEADTILDVVYIQQGSEEDRSFLPPINDRDTIINEYDQRGAIVWLTNKSLPDTELNPYFLYRHEDWQVARPGIAEGDKGEVYTGGLRVKRAFNDRWSAMGSMAGQFGHRGGRDIEAMGFNSDIVYRFQDQAQSTLTWEYEYRSGDDDDTDEIETFDIMWGRYPQFSEIYNGYLDAGETGLPALSSNLHRLGMRFDTRPTDKLGVALGYHLLWADENNLSQRPGFSQSGSFRGQLASAILTFDQNEHVSHTLTGELFCPGNYYSEEMNEPAVFARYQLMLRW